MRIGTKVGALAVLGTLAMALAANASANTVTYAGEATDLKPGQTKGLPVLMDFDLRGKKCPEGPKCFKNATIKGFTGVSYAFPTCPDLLDSAFVLGDPNVNGPIEDAETIFDVTKKRKFKETGGNALDFTDVVSVEGRFKKKGKSASGSFTVVREGQCSTLEITWKATPED
jgi:hypothetical protein